MKKIVARTVALSAIAVLGLGLSACSSSDEKAAENMTAACDAVADLGTTIDTAKSSLNASSTVEQWQTARDDIKKQVEATDKALEKVGEDYADQIDEAWDSFDQAVNDIDSSSTIPEAGATLVEEVQGIQTARTEALSGLDCK